MLHLCRSGLAALGLLCALVSDGALAQRTNCEGGAAVSGTDSFACDGVDLLGRLPVEAMGSSFANDIWGWTDPVTGTEYALIGLSDATAFVSLADPEAPALVGRLPTHTGASTWRDVKVYDDHAFVVSEAIGHGMQVFDLTVLRDVTAPPVTFSETAHYDGIGAAHNVAVNEASGFAYVVGADECAGGLHMVDVREPTVPTFAGCFAEDGYTHDVQCVIYDGPDTEHAGAEVCFAANEDILTLVDVTDKQNPALLGQALYPNIGYAHQGWLSADHRFFFANDEADESIYGLNTRTFVFDVTDLDEPEFTFAYEHPTASYDHNLYVRDGYVFASNYTSGLRILDAAALRAGRSAGATVGSFDTYPRDDGTGFGGQWSNYPFFESGVVIASDQANGLFVLAPTVLAAPPAPPPEQAALDVFPTVVRRGEATRVTVRVSVPEAQRVWVAVYDLLGRRVAAMHDGAVEAGVVPLALSADRAGLPAGTFLVRAAGDGFSLTRRLTVVR